MIILYSIHLCFVFIIISAYFSLLTSIIFVLYYVRDLILYSIKLHSVLFISIVLTLYLLLLHQIIIYFIVLHCKSIFYFVLFYSILLYRSLLYHSLCSFVPFSYHVPLRRSIFYLAHFYSVLFIILSYSSTCPIHILPIHPYPALFTLILPNSSFCLIYPYPALFITKLRLYVTKNEE